MCNVIMNVKHLLPVIVLSLPSPDQAQTKEVCDMWTSEIRRLLEVQLTLMKG